MKVLRIVAISDTHMYHKNIALPPGDILIHAGDFTKMGTIPELGSFTTWFRSQPHEHKILIAGNHERGLEEDHVKRSFLYGFTYLQNTGKTVAGIKFWGSPCTPRFFDWEFNKSRGAEIAEVWKEIPVNVDVLITHGPPANILDMTLSGENVGCEDLLEACVRKKPRCHIFGHIHEGYGTYRSAYGTLYVNASTCDRRYQPINAPILLDVTLDDLGNVLSISRVPD